MSRRRLFMQNRISSNCIKMEVTGGTTTCTISQIGTGDTIEMSYDAINWFTPTVGTEYSNSGPIYVRGKYGSTSRSSNNLGIKASGHLSGNIAALIDYENPPTELTYERCFHYLFDSSTITSVDEDFLPFTTLSGYCYKYMFVNCTSLTNAPELPATTLKDGCYLNMFSGCTSLTTAPNLPATTIEMESYSCMFSNCTSLTTAPTISVSVTEVKTFGCFKMFYNCTSLTTAPTLSATTLWGNCYWCMFEGCTSLTTAPELPATTLEDCCYQNMFSGCTSLSAAPELPATTLKDGCYLNMFSGCTSLSAAPALPATTLEDGCYRSMFSGCTSLQSVTMRATHTSASYCLLYWLSDAGTSVTNPILYVDSTMTTNSVIVANKGNFTIQSYN